MANPVKLPAMIVHERDPQHLETPRDVLAAGGLTPTAGFYVRSHGDRPVADPEGLRLRVESAAGLWNPQGYVNNAWGRVRVDAS